MTEQLTLTNSYLFREKEACFHTRERASVSGQTLINHLPSFKLPFLPTQFTPMLNLRTMTVIRTQFQFGAQL